MAMRSFSPIRAIQREAVVIFGGGTGAGASDLTSAAGPGVASIAYNSATGKVKVTLASKFNSLLFVSGTVIDATTPDDWEVVVESESVASAGTISLCLFKGGTLTDLTTDEKLRLMIVVSNTSRTY